MKTSCFLFLLLILSSCNTEKFQDQRPQTQTKFISYFKVLRDAVNASDKNKILRNSLLEANIPAVKSYIKDTLNLSIKDWQVRLIEKTDNYLQSGNVQIKLSIAYDPYDESSSAINQSIILTAVIPASNKTVFDSINVLELNDYLKINGQFIEKGGFIDIDSYSNYKFSKNVLDNPEFKLLISEIKNYNLD